MRILQIILAVIVFFLLIVWAFAWYRTVRAERSPNQKLFSGGNVPDPDGLYTGRVTGYGGSWRGKSFDAASKTGINVFGEDRREKYPFVFYEAGGIRDTEKKVLRIDYDVSQNPFWLRPVADEIVEYEPGKYIGKLNVRWIPGMPFTLGYFFLEK